MTTSARPSAEPAAQRVDAALARAGERASLGAFLCLDPIGARSAARKADGLDATQRALRPLLGLPIAVKDNIDVAGLPTTAGSPALAGHVPRRHATAVARLVAAGAVVIGKTNLHEFALGVTTNNVAFGPARNPYAPDRIAGGSSGGSAVAVAARLVPAALGTDTGGSIRIPAALCGVVGFRPTAGRWPSDGVVPISATRDTVGPMALSAAECALLDAVVCNETLTLAAARLEGLRLGVPRRLFWEDLDPAMAAAAEAALVRLAGAGVELVPCDVAIDGDECARAGLVIAMAENLPGLRRYFESHGLPFDARRVAEAVAGADVRAAFAHILGGEAPTPADHAHALQVQRRAFQCAYARCFAEHRVEALIFPTTPLPAARIGEDDVVSLRGRPVSTFFTYTRNAGPASVVGLPSISLPMGLSEAGLPLGIELDAPAGADRRLLAIAMAIEALWPVMPAPAP